jgi:hypothetical protein
MFVLSFKDIEKNTNSLKTPWSRFRMRPGFIILGVQKGGTTTLYDLLSQHSQIKPASRKEINFFNAHYSKGLKWYQKKFPVNISRFWTKQLRITGEASPNYMFLPHVPERLAATLPEAKLIVLLRNPTDRAYSHYHHVFRRKIETLPFEQALAKEDERLSGELDKLLKDPNRKSFNYQKFSYLARGIYVDQLKRFAKFFCKEKILVIKSEDFFHKTQEILGQVFDFLGLEEWQPKKIKPLNTGRYSKIDAKTKEFLDSYFKPHNQRLYHYLGRDFDW